MVVQNGIVENFLELKDELTAEGVEFQSDTDTETIVHLVEHYQAAGLGFVEAARRTFQQIRGANVVVLMSADEPDKIVTARIGNAGGVVIGLGEGENFIASDIPAIMEHTRTVIFLESRQMAVVTCDKVRVETLEGAEIKPEVHTVAWDPVAAEKGEYRHFMQKEIHEQVRSLTDTLAGPRRFRARRDPPARSESDRRARASGSRRSSSPPAARPPMPAWSAKYLIEKIARIPVEVVIASEFRYSDPIIDEPHGRAGHQPIGRNGRHAGRDGGRPPQGRAPLEHRQRHRLAGDAPGGWIHLDADRTRRSVWPRRRPSPPRW